LNAVVNPFKYLEGETIPQYLKMEKKIIGGAKFLINQLGYDSRKMDELIRYRNERGYNTPIIANIFLLVSNLLMIPVFVNAIRLVEKHLSVLVLALCCVGAYALNYSFFNVWLMLIFGLFGYVTKKFKLPTGPLILSVVLASSLESYFRQSLMLSKGSYMIFLTRPVSLVILLIIVGTAIFSVVNNQIKKKKKAASKA
jgi:putative tricarboxylic transport membrane protein